MVGSCRVLSLAKAFSKFAACCCHAGSWVRGANGDFFDSGIPARNRAVSSGGGGPDKGSGRSACDGATVGAGVGLSCSHGNLNVACFGGPMVGEGAGPLRCHGHMIAEALLNQKAKTHPVARAIGATRKFFIGED